MLCLISLMAAEIDMLRKANDKFNSPENDGFETITVTRNTAKTNLVSSVGHQSRAQGQGYSG